MDLRWRPNNDGGICDVFQISNLSERNFSAAEVLAYCMGVMLDFAIWDEQRKPCRHAGTDFM